ncbi:MAG TPA: peroxiredoxin [Planctomycetaceae bacterium]|nr:peroxiredoxin [Planctomycetaceae bacterium]HRF02555.1 OsmC family protein [Pirellulaceae bacterium]
MDAETIRANQAPLKRQYREAPESAWRTLRAEGVLAENPTVCEVASHLGTIPAGLHVNTGGDGSHACAGNMLLESLVACAGVTLGVVSTALGLPLTDVRVTAEGDVDFRGTMGVDRSVPVGFQAIRLKLAFTSGATEEQVAKLLELTERYCIIHQTLSKAVPCTIERVAG